MTDKILIDRSVLQQAASALQSSQEYVEAARRSTAGWGAQLDRAAAAIKNLREALAAPQTAKKCWKCGDADPAFQARCGVPACGMRELPQPAQTALSAPDSASVDALVAPQPLFTGLIAQHPGLADELAAQEPACPVCQNTPKFTFDRRVREWAGRCRNCGVDGPVGHSEKEAIRKWVEWHHKAPQPAPGVDWQNIGALMDAHGKAKAVGLIGGTTSWGAFVAREMMKVAPQPAEPVAWIDAVMEQAQSFASAWSLVGGPFDDGTGLDAAEEEKNGLRAMLTTPQPQRQPLTDEQIIDKLMFLSPGCRDDLIAFARSIEAAHGITKGKE